MPFLDHFGLYDYPFGLTPDVDLFYPAEPVAALLDGVVFSLNRGDGLIKIVGPVGSGKTLLCRMLLEKLRGKKNNTAYFSIPVGLDCASIPRHIGAEFGVKIPDGADAMAALTAYLIKQTAKGKRNILIIDEAQTLGPAGLEAVRLMSNLETARDKLIQIALFGQQELDAMLRAPALRQIAERIQFSFTTRPLPAAIACDYVRFRMDKMSHPGARRCVFPDAVLIRLVRAARGLPRLIHLLADKCLIAAYADGAAQVAPHHLRTALRETPDVNWGWYARWLRWF